MPSVFVAATRVRSRSLLVAASFAAALALGLSGCAAEQEPAPAPSTDASAEPSGTPEPTAVPAPEETVQPGTPVTIGCDALLNLDDIYAFNPNVGTDPGFTAAEGSLAAAAVADNGIACGFVHQTSGEQMSFALSQPSPEQLTLALNAAATSSSPVPTYGAPPAVTGFFTPATGQVQVFTPTMWLTAESPMFFEPGDAEQLVSAALSHLPG